MKKNFLKKGINIFLAGILAVGMLSGCGNKETNSSESTPEKAESTSEKPSAEVASESTQTTQEEGITYPLDTDVTLKIATFSHAAVDANFEGKQATPFIEELQKRTGVKVELVELSDDAYKLLLTGGDIGDYDILWNNYNLLPGSPEVCIEDELILPLNDYMDECMPDYKAALDSKLAYKKGATTPEGYVFGAGMLKESKYLQISTGVMVRWDWLEDLNMEIPETADEFYDMLVAFRDQKGAEVPLSISLSQLTNQLLQGEIEGAFGIAAAEYYVEDGKVHYGIAEPGMKDVYAYLHKLYEEGLLDPEYATLDKATAKANLLTGRSGATTGAVGGGIGSYMNEMQDDPKFNLTGVPSLVAKKGDTPKMALASTAVSNVFACVLKSCKNPEIAAKFLNYGYTEEGINFWNFGIEGVSYNMVDGYPTYTDLIMKNPDGWSVQQAMAAYSFGYSGAISIQQDEYMEQYSALPGQKKALEMWTKADIDTYQLPPVTISTEDNDEYSRINSEVWTYYEQMLVAYINGTKSLDDFESEYLGTLKNLNVDRMIEIMQKAYDEYMAK